MNNNELFICFQGTSVCQVTLIGIMVVFLYASRACYNLVVLALTNIETINSFDYDWYNVSDQVGFVLHFNLPAGACRCGPKQNVTSDLSCVPPGGLAVVAGRRWLHRVRGDSVRLGAAAHLAGRLLLQGPTAASGKGQSSWRLC